MSTSNDGSLTPRSQHASNCFDDLLDSIIADVASECHRIARLGLDRSLEAEEEELRLSQLSDSTRGAAGGEGSSKHGVDIFGQSHPAVASDIFECMNCGRPIVAGRFAPHLEKCMGNGRNSRAKATRSSTVTRSRHSRGSPVSVYAPYSTSAQRAPNGTASGVSEDPSDYNIEEQ
ncbi:SAGA-associated factor-like protein [Carex rostrata]